MTHYFDKVEDCIFSKNVIQAIAWICFLGGIISWPLTAVTVFKNEPQGILGLSFLAIIFTGFQILQQMFTQRKLVLDEDGDGV